jgi:two-component system, chemotaxis family, protein-glutamate methylesterase/glutaminase
MINLTRVLVVDDSAYVRKVIKQMLGRSPFIEVVGTARNGEEALELVEELSPDVVTCDLNMPAMDGVTFVREQMARRPVPIIIISIASEAAEPVLAALEAGAIDFVQKPTALATDKLLDIAEELIEKVKAAAQAPRTSLVRPPAVAAPEELVREIRPRLDKGGADIVVIGTSTGGPQALKAVMPLLRADFPVPVAMVLHMPAGYTEAYAKKLDEMCLLHVVEAQGGEVVKPGMAFLAPAGRHLGFRRNPDGTITTRLDMRPLDTPHRPAVDVLFQSASEAYGSRVLGVVMTGMGADGREGCAWIKAKGGHVITEAEVSCVVYGMPRAVVDAGLSDEQVPLEGIARTIMERV